MSRFDTNKITWPEDQELPPGPHQFQASAAVDPEKTPPVVPARAYEELLESARRMAYFLDESLGTLRGEFTWPGMEVKPGSVAEGIVEAQAVIDDFTQGVGETHLFPVITREVAEAFVHGSPDDHRRAEMALQKQLDLMLRSVVVE